MLEYSQIRKKEQKYEKVYIRGSHQSKYQERGLRLQV